MYSIQDGKPRKLRHANQISKKKLDQLQKKWGNKPSKASDLFWAYHKLIIEEMSLPDQEFGKSWKQLTVPQKCIYTLGHLIGQIDNGGVWQFFYNRTNLAMAGVETLYEINMFQYTLENCLNEFGEMIQNGTYEELVNQINNPKISEEERWKFFKSGAKHIPSAEGFEQYFYEKKYKQRFYGKINDYIELNMNKLAEVQGDQPQVVMQKKDAIPHFTEYLKDFYKQDPTSVEVYYSKSVTIANLATKLYLMQFEMPDGTDGIGITGHFTHHFADVSLEEIMKMHKRYHKQRLINIYYGWFLMDQELQQNPKANEVDTEKWEDLLTRLQSKKHSQVPVNVKFKEYFKLGKSEYYLYSGDLLYNDDAEAFPADLDAVELAGVSEKRKDTPLRGEKNLLFHTWWNKRKSPDFGRGSAKEPVESKHKLAAVIGRENKLLKDNPWGF